VRGQPQRRGRGGVAVVHHGPPALAPLSSVASGRPANGRRRVARHVRHGHVLARFCTTISFFL
jgi:hypothetical protein